MNQKKFLVTMLGPRGVGKTSILAGMYDQFDRAAKYSKLSLSPDHSSSAKLSSKLGELKSQTETFTASGGLAGTADAQSFIFDLGLEFEEPEMNIVFQDYPGGWFSGEDSSKSKIVEEAIRDSQMIILAIDTPALMEKNGQWNELVNKPRLMSDFFKRAFRGINSSKLLLMVPVKCESYVQNKQSTEKLSTAIKDAYAPLITSLRSVDKLAVAIAPIQTLGNVRFSHYNQHDGFPEACFSVCKNNGNPYEPKNVEQVLFYMLNFALHQHVFIDINQQKKNLETEKKEVGGYMENRSWLRKIVSDSIIDLDEDERNKLYSIKGDLSSADRKLSQFGKSIDKLSKRCIYDGKYGFEIIQGETLLQLSYEYSNNENYEYA